jgi:hypothetical protein
MAMAAMTFQSAQASPSSEAERLLNHSRFVDSEHPCRVSLGKDGKQAGVTLFAQHQSRDQDCKITALLITKELSQHYPDLQLTRISFFDEIAQGNSRIIIVGKDQVRMVDSGQKVQNVLAKLKVVHKNFSTDISPSKSVSASASASTPASTPAAALGSARDNQDNYYNLIRARGQTVLAQNTVRVSSKNSEWVPTAIAVKRGQMMWVEIKDDIGSSVVAGDSARNILPNQPGGALLAKISEDGGMFVVEKSNAPILAPENGQIYLLINHSTSEEQQINVAKSVRILVSH